VDIKTNLDMNDIALNSLDDYDNSDLKAAKNQTSWLKLFLSGFSFSAIFKSLTSAHSAFRTIIDKEFCSIFKSGYKYNFFMRAFVFLSK
jgi:hypothetical protein